MTREHVMVKIYAEPSQRVSVISMAGVFRANVVDVGEKSMIVELTGESSKVEAFIEIVKPLGLVEVVRSGITGLTRGLK